MIIYDIGGPVGESSDLPSTSPQSAPTQGRQESADLSGFTGGLVNSGARAGVGYAAQQAGIPGYSGLPGAVSSGVAAAFKDGSTAEDIGYAALTGGVTSAVMSGLSKAGVPGAVTSTAYSALKESFKDDPNYGKAVTSSALPGIVGTVAGLVAGPVAGFLTGTLTGYATENSLLDGTLGDLTDSRSREKDRDVAEDHGFSRDQTASAAQADIDTRGDLPGAFGFGLTDAVNSTTTGNIAEAASLTDTVAEGLMSKASQNALGDPDSLQSFASSLGYMDDSAVSSPDTASSPSETTTQESSVGWGDVSGLTGFAEKEGAFGNEGSGSGTDGSGTGEGATDGSDGGSQDGSGV